MDLGSGATSDILTLIWVSHECREIIQIVVRPQQSINSRNHSLRDEHQFKPERAGDVDEGRRARSTASGFYLTIAGTRYACHLGNLFLCQLPDFTGSFQQLSDFQQSI
ncbi:hypothetical protein GGE47_003933 [Agrobacterium tumefaciens]|nr:hypothetical protein [Agrobacterium radiobacter]MBB4337206.1 hypothetical protein [Agrobacterium radiobacter]MBB4502645.1 hypothetical protein [Agrobacterium radiobacter]MBB4557363.1 hypothetical protein [Agrobacterium radiobacter]